MAVTKIKEKIHMNLQIPYQVFKLHKFSKSQTPKTQTSMNYEIVFRKIPWNKQHSFFVHWTFKKFGRNQSLGQLQLTI